MNGAITKLADFDVPLYIFGSGWESVTPQRVTFRTRAIPSSGTMCGLAMTYW